MASFANIIVLISLCSAGACVPTGGDDGGALPVDCTDLGNLHDPKCTSPITDPSNMAGSGPRFVGTLDVVHPGFVDGNRIIATLQTAGGGVILAVDVDTGARTEISGPDVGTGAKLPGLFDVQPGPDGWYALGNGEVWRVDPATGNRSQVWSSTTGPNCAADSAMFTVGGIAVGPDKTIYLPVITAVGANAGVGLAAIANTTCKLVTHTGFPTASNRGTGPVVGFTQLTFRDGIVWFFRGGSTIGKVDPATGNRTVISDSTPATMVGTGTGIGHDSFAFSVDGKTAWTACGSDQPFVDVDLSTGDRTGSKLIMGPLSIGGPWCTIWVHPTKSLLVVEDANGFSLYEPSTGNNNLLSY